MFFGTIALLVEDVTDCMLLKEFLSSDARDCKLMNKKFEGWAFDVSFKQDYKGTNVVRLTSVQTGEQVVIDIPFSRICHIGKVN